METGCQIGRRLIEDAIWHEDRCNWLGFIPDGPAGNLSRKYSALGPDLYDGTSGIAWFLAHLSAVTGDRKARLAAIGAARQALSRLERLPLDAPFGLFTGWTGIALVAARLGVLLGAPELKAKAVLSVQQRAAHIQRGSEFDIISGRAGAIAALVVLSKILDDPSLLEIALRLGTELLQAADYSSVGCSWKGAIKFQFRNLVGFSHGTAGAAYALLELFQATGVIKYREAAEQAFGYERHWFDAETLNWPDFRKEPTESVASGRMRAFSVVWCHGAPGIALSRIRAYHLLKKEIYKTEAECALQTTRESVTSGLASGTGNYSLCHGLAGNAEVLVHGCEVLAREPLVDRELAYDVARSGIENHAENQSWPGGSQFGYPPGLMLGLAGTGYFYLRLYEPDLPSILLLRHDAFC